MSKLPKYMTYKDSGVEWLGKIPEHWEVKPGFTILYEAKEKNKGMKRNTVLSLSYGKIRIKEEEELTGLVPESFETYQLVNKGDIIFRPTDLQNDHVSLRSGISEFEGIITSAYLNLRLRPIANNKFYSYFFRGIDNNKVIYGLGSGLRQNIDFRDFKRFDFPFPPLPEQTAIANFLGRKTELIDKAIAIKVKQIELLKERRQILIHRAVTRGLNPNVKLKDSGVEWIGEIPEGWILLAMNYAINAIADVDHYMPPTIERGIPYVMTGDLEEFASDIDFDGCKKVSQRDYYNLSKKIKCSLGDVILARYATIGTASYIDVDLNFLVSYSCVTIKTNPPKLLGLYLFYYFKSNAFAIDVSNQVNTNTQGNVGIGNLKKVKLILPPINEQKDIIEYIKNITTKIATAISLKEQEIEKLKEYKASLINEAVTGKVMVG